ncbi:MAG: alkaline phosphatase family protein [Candidatus Dormibacteraceae bacterium]
MENHSYSQVMGAPYISSLAAQGGVAGNYHAVTHPSLPNYIALTSGDTQGISSDCQPSDCSTGAASIADRLNAAGKSWREYAEDMPSPCYGQDADPYYAKHDPFVYYTRVTHSGQCASHVVSFDNLAGDLSSTASTPDFAFITPNICNDMHNCDTGAGDNWLSQHVPQILGSPAFTAQRSLLVVVWDENDGSSGNQVACVFVGYHVRHGVSSVYYTHYSLLRTFEVALGLQPLTGNDGNASPMGSLFN